ncbi:MAG: hypothetical protein R3Y26_03500 [Rikenellaceae bacterium]
MGKKENPRWLLTEQENRNIMLPDTIQPTLNEPIITHKKDKLVLSSDNKGASIVYKVNGKGRKGTNAWMIYTEPIEGLIKGDSVTVVATRAGYKNSSRVEITL